MLSLIQKLFENEFYWHYSRRHHSPMFPSPSIPSMKCLNANSRRHVLDGRASASRTLKWFCSTKNGPWNASSYGRWSSFCSFEINLDALFVWCSLVSVLHTAHRNGHFHSMAGRMILAIVHSKVTCYFLWLNSLFINNAKGSLFVSDFCTGLFFLPPDCFIPISGTSLSFNRELGQKKSLCTYSWS